MGLSSFFKNLFGTAKDSATDLAHQAETTFEQAKEAAAPYIDKAETFAEETFAKAKEASEPLIETATDYAHQAKDIVSEYVEKASDSISDVIDSVKEIKSEWLINAQKVLITAGASAPEDVVEECVDWLRVNYNAQVENRIIREEHVQFPLPRELRVISNSTS